MKWTNSLNEIIRMSRCMQCVCCALSLTEKCAECLHQIWSEPTKKQQQHTNNWEKRLNSNLTKWLNAKVAPIFALRLRITAFLTFFCRCIRCIEFIFVLPCFRFVTQCTQQQCLCCWCFFFLHSFVSFVYSTIVRELRAKQKGKCLPFIISKTTSHSIWVNMYRR